jgi:hypothetical protein
MKQKNLWPTDPAERALAQRIVAARSVKDLEKAEYRAQHKDKLCDPMTGFCATMAAGFYHAMDGHRGPYELFRIGTKDLGRFGHGEEDTHYFLVDLRKLQALAGPLTSKMNSSQAFGTLAA